MIYVVAIIAGAAGAVVRYLVALGFVRRHEALPWAVLTVNTVGCAVAGTALGLAEAQLISADLMLLLLGGVAGGLTTFSTWSVETIQLLQEGKWREMVLSVLLNLGFGLIAVLLGWAAVTAGTTWT